MSEQDIPHEIVDDDGAAGTGMLLQGQALPDRLHILPIHNRPFFPGQVLPIMVNPEHWAQTIAEVAKTEHHCVALFYMDNPPQSAEEFDHESLPEHGTVVRIHRASKQDDTLQFVAQGLARVRG